MAMKFASLFVYALLLVSLPTATYAQDGYPRIGLLFAGHQNSFTPEQVARYDLIVDGGLFYSLGDDRMAVVRQLNPHFVGLNPEVSAYVNFDSNTLSAPGFQEEYLAHFSSSGACDVDSRVAFPGWEYPIYIWNFVHEPTVDFMVNFAIQRYQFLQDNYPHFYDGFAIDGAHLIPPWYDWHPTSSFDLDCDGDVDQFDSEEYVTPFWRKNVIAYVKRLREALPGIVIIGNDTITYKDNVNSG